MSCMLQGGYKKGFSVRGGKPLSQKKKDCILSDSYAFKMLIYSNQAKEGRTFCVNRQAGV